MCAPITSAHWAWPKAHAASNAQGSKRRRTCISRINTAFAFRQHDQRIRLRGGSEPVRAVGRIGFDLQQAIGAR
jgi:hypothetical protein